MKRADLGREGVPLVRGRGRGHVPQNRENACFSLQETGQYIEEMPTSDQLPGGMWGAGPYPGPVPVSLVRVSVRLFLSVCLSVPQAGTSCPAGREGRLPALLPGLRVQSLRAPVWPLCPLHREPSQRARGLNNGRPSLPSGRHAVSFELLVSGSEGPTGPWSWIPPQ